MPSNACLNTCVMLINISGTKDRSVRDVVIERYSKTHPLHARVRQRLSCAMHREGAPDPVPNTYELSGGKLWPLKAYQVELLNPEQYERGRVAMRLLRWVAHIGPELGDNNDGVGLYRRVVRAGLSTLEMIVAGLAGEEVSTEHYELVQAFRDLSRSGRDEFLFQFGKPLETVERREDRALSMTRILTTLARSKPDQKSVLHDGTIMYRKLKALSLVRLQEVAESVGKKEASGIALELQTLSGAGRESLFACAGTTRRAILGHSRTRGWSEIYISKKAVFVAVALFSAFVVAFSPFSPSVTWAVLKEDGPVAAMVYAGRSGVLQSDSPKDVRTAAYLYYRNRRYDLAIKTSLKLLGMKTTNKILGDAHMVMADSFFSKGRLHEAESGYSQALDLYDSKYSKTFAFAGLAKVSYYENGESSLEQFEGLLALYKAAGNRGDLETYAYYYPLMVSFDEAEIHCEKYIEFYTQRKKYNELATMYIAYSQVLIKRDPAKAHLCASNALAIARNLDKSERIEVFALAMLYNIEKNPLFLKTVEKYLKKQSDFVLSRYLSDLEIMDLN